VDNPEAMCGWLEQRAKEGELEEGDKAIWGADVEFMSVVSTPAVTDSEFLQIKSKSKDPDKVQIKSFMPLLRRKSQKDPDDRIVYAPALIPDKADGNKEAIPKWEIKKAAVKYMEEYRKVDNEHSFMDGDGIPIFSWILQKDETFTKLDGTEKFLPEGTWMMGIKITNDNTWEQIKSGDRTGFSIAGSWKVLELKSRMDIMEKERVYIDSPKDAPSDADVQQGPRGGYYYETGPGGKPKPEAKPVKPKTPTKVAKENVGKRREEAASNVKQDPKNERYKGYFDGVNEASKAKNFSDVKVGGAKAFREWEDDKSTWGAAKIAAYKDVMTEDYGISNKDAIAILKGNKKELDPFYDAMNEQTKQDGRPPKAWWDKCEAHVRETMPGYTDEQVAGTCGHIYYEVPGGPGASFKESMSDSEMKELITKQVIEMEEKEFMEFFKKAMADYEKAKAQEQSQKTEEEELKKLLTSLNERLEKLEKPEETKQEEEDEEEEEEEKKQEDEEEEEEEEKKEETKKETKKTKVMEKAKKELPKQEKQEKNLTGTVDDWNSKITIKKEPYNTSHLHAEQ